MGDQTQALCERVAAAFRDGTSLAIRGGGSKAFYGRPPEGEPLETGGHRGIVSYEPQEMVLTARAGTPLAEVEAALADAGQLLPFEPPAFGDGATVGGAVAAGLSGPRRPYAGALRDFVLGVRIVNGRGEALRFGGEVIKNVAGYDLSRAMAGAMGTLGLLLEVSLRVLPRPPRELTLAYRCSAGEAPALFERWGRRPLPISAGCHLDHTLYLRLSGGEAALRAAREALGGEPIDDDGLWRGLRDHRLPFFAGDGPLWRISVPATAPAARLTGSWLLDWGGAQRWLRSDEPADVVRAEAERLGGHAILFRGGERRQPFHPLPAALMALHRRLKAAFDPAGVLNPGRLYPGM
jgi:glycolate oxidase FAD binding subunit